MEFEHRPLDVCINQAVTSSVPSCGLRVYWLIKSRDEARIRKFQPRVESTEGWQ